MTDANLNANSTPQDDSSSWWLRVHKYSDEPILFTSKSISYRSGYMTGMNMAQDYLRANIGGIMRSADDKEQARKKIYRDFGCSHDVLAPNPVNCKGCQYFYRDRFNNNACLKQDIKYWCLYHVNTEE